jgi:hypothetical protein
MADKDDTTGKCLTKTLEAMLSVGNTGSVDLDSLNTNTNKSVFPQVQIRREVLVCYKCEKEFDSSAPNCDPVLSFCSICNVDCQEEDEKARREREETDQREESPGEEADDFDDVDDDDQTYERIPDDEQDRDIDRVEGYTGFKDGQALGDFFHAATRAPGNTCSVIIGKLGLIEFDQKEDPEDYRMSDRHGNFKFVKQPLKRPKNVLEKLVLYGYDRVDAHVYTNKNKERVAFLGLTPIMCNDYATGNVLVTMGSTRCSKRRLDGFLYNIRQAGMTRLSVRIFQKIR